MTATEDYIDTLITVDTTTRGNAITAAVNYLGLTTSETGQKAWAVALLAVKIIQHKRAADKSRTTPDMEIPISIDDLISDEIKRLVTDPDDFASSETSFYYNTDHPADNERWDGG